MKIAFYEIAEWEATYVKQHLSGHELLFFPTGFNNEHRPVPDADVISTFTGSRVTKDILVGTPKLKAVMTRTTGFDHIDTAACAAGGVVVSNVPTYGDSTVAEYTFALLLALSRKMYPAIKRVREEGKFNFEFLRGFDLKDKTFGVIGTGHIGACVIKIAKGFGMEVLAFDPYPKKTLAGELGFAYVLLEQLLGESDIVSLHVPYMPSTHHLLNKERFALMKRGCVLINTSRGGLIDTAALVSALTDGTVAACGLDVLEEEGYVKDELNLLAEGHPNEQQMRTVLADHALMQMENVIVTPHNAFHTTEAIQRILDTTVENIVAFAAGKPVNTVTK